MNWESILSGLYGVILAGFSISVMAGRPAAISQHKLSTPALVGTILLGILLILWKLQKKARDQRETIQPAPMPPPQVIQPAPMTPSQAPQVIQPAPMQPIQAPQVIQPAPMQPSQAPQVIQPEPMQPIQAPQVIQPIQPPQVIQPAPMQPMQGQIPQEPAVVQLVEQPAPQQVMTMDEFEKWARENDPQLLALLQGTAPASTPTRPPQTRPPAPSPSAPSRPPQTRPPTTRPPTTRPLAPSPSAPSPAPTPSAPVSGTTGSSLTTAEAQEMVDSHNRRRARFGNSPLTWDPEIARSAQAWTEQQAAMGQMKHSSGSPYGENLSWSSGMNQTPEDIVVGWSDEEEPFYDYASNSCKGGVCLHHTQVVDRRSSRIGCGRVNKGRETYWTCQYFEPGNMRGERPYVK